MFYSILSEEWGRIGERGFSFQPIRNNLGDAVTITFRYFKDNRLQTCYGVGFNMHAVARSNRKGHVEGGSLPLNQ